MDMIILSLKANKDPIVDDNSRNLDARKLADLLPKDISQMSLKNQEHEVRTLLSVLAESEKLDLNQEVNLKKLPESTAQTISEPQRS
jgi:hypothetical protein